MYLCVRMQCCWPNFDENHFIPRSLQSTKHVLIRKDFKTILCSVRCTFLVPREESVHSWVPHSGNDPRVYPMLHAEPGWTLAGERHSQSPAIWPCQKQSPSAAAVAGCGDDGWPLQRQPVLSQAPSSLQDTMAHAVAISVLGWFSALKC